MPPPLNYTVRKQAVITCPQIHTCVNRFEVHYPANPNSQTAHLETFSKSEKLFPIVNTVFKFIFICLLVQSREQIT